MRTLEIVLCSLFLVVGCSSHKENIVTENSVVAVGGYDVVSYHQGEKPQRGNGNHITDHAGATYLFANDENKEEFEKDPQKYIPAFGGYCAYGVSVNKKFVGDPDVWKIVDEKLYLNLDTGIQEVWSEDVPGNIEKANENWQSIKHVAPQDL
ncbi:YHS domain-containing (seleno)protein [Candidatus Uabimicrobium sp. HlEnr_7]|uniref:YHS domain-containing (seleno)protein n=1 Tax=Candidatus Uabimicrobium helgolandensis TaxID=3095367 RepID=UPI003556F463